MLFRNEGMMILITYHYFGLDPTSLLQAFANISVTGELDGATRSLLERPRCGVPDYLSGQFRSRRKRFIVQGQKWQNTSLTWR